MRALLKSGRYAVAAACVVALILPSLSRAGDVTAGGPPYITDDPEPVELYHSEFYIASYYFHGAFGTLGTLPHFEYNYGAAPNLQVHIISPMAYAQAPGGPFNYGYGATELGVKYRFIQEGKTTPMIGVFPLIEARISYRIHFVERARQKAWRLS